MIYSRLVRTGVEKQGNEHSLQREIPLPGLSNTRSQLAVPLLAHNHLLGVLCLQSEDAGRFTAVDERLALVAARQIAATMTMIRLQAAVEPEESPRGRPSAAGQTGPCSVIKHFGSDDSVFIDDVYLVKGVPGRILRKIAFTYLSEGRSEFSNKEIRLDSSLQLPDFKDNLETRLILLRRRIEERCDFLQIVPIGEAVSASMSSGGLSSSHYREARSLRILDSLGLPAHAGARNTRPISCRQQANALIEYVVGGGCRQFGRKARN